MAALLNVKQFVRFDEHGNLHVPNKLFVACQAYVQTPFLNDTSSRVATTEWVRAQISSLTGVTVSETDPIWVFEKALYYTKLQADARYLQSFTETDPTVSAWAKASVKPTYTFAELLSKPTTIAGYGITDIPTTLPASDVYAWAKAATKPSYAYSEITGLPALFSGSYTDLTNKPTIPAAQVNSDWTATTGLAQILNKPTLFSGSYTDLTNKPTIPTYTLSGLGGQPLDADLTAIAALAGTAGFLKKTAADTWALDNNTYLTSYTETDPIWTAEKTNYALKTYVDTSISNLVASAPATLDTLNELALALGSDANFSTTVTTLIGTKATDSAVVHLAGTETITGAKTFSAAVTNDNGLKIKFGSSANLTASYLTLSAYGETGSFPDRTILRIGTSDTYFSLIKFRNNTSYTYDSPASSGTLALTSDIPSLANYVTLDGTQTITGDKTFTSDLKSAMISIANSNTLYTRTAYTTLSASNVGTTSWIAYVWGNVGGGAAVLAFNNAAQYTYTYPALSGTVALISNLSSYVPTSRTLTINGTAYDLSADRAWTITTASTYTLPIATSSVLGGIKVGTNLSIDGNGVLSSTDTNTTYSAFTRTVVGLVPNPGGSTTNRYLREDGTWVIPPDTDTDTIYVHPTTAGNKHIPAGGAAGQILRWSADGAATWGADVDTDTTYVVFTRSANGLAPAAPAGTGTTKYLREDGTWQVPPDTDTNTTYSAFTGATASANGTSGLVTAPVIADRVKYLKGDGTWGVPTDTDTTYAAFTGSTTLVDGAAGLVPKPVIANRLQYLRGDGTWATPPDTDTDTNTVTSIRREDADGTTSATAYRTGDIRLRQGANVTITEVSAGIFQIASSYVDTDTNTWNANTKTVAGYVAAPGDVANKVWKTDASGNPGWRDDADTDTNTTYTAGTGLTLTGTVFSVTKTITAVETPDTIALRNGSGQLVATGFYQTSSRELKTNISPFVRSALDIIRDVTVVSFNYKTDIINKHIGFIAEDTPEELSTRNKNVMDSNNTIGVLLKAVQELEARIKQLESK